MPDAPEVTVYGRLKLHGLSARGLHRYPEWRLVREFEPTQLARIRAACERSSLEAAGYMLYMFDNALQTERDKVSETWAWELVVEAETGQTGTLKRRVRRRR